MAPSTSVSAAGSANDISRVVIFAVAVLGLVAIARFREQKRRAEASL